MFFNLNIFALFSYFLHISYGLKVVIPNKYMLNTSIFYLTSILIRRDKKVQLMYNLLTLSIFNFKQCCTKVKLFHVIFNISYVYINNKSYIMWFKYKLKTIIFYHNTNLTSNAGNKGSIKIFIILKV